MNTHQRGDGLDKNNISGKNQPAKPVKPVPIVYQRFVERDCGP